MLSAALASATTSAASHWIIFFLNGRSALRALPWEECRSIPTLADSLLFQHRPSFESGSALGASFPARMLGVHLLCKELKPKQPKTETPGLKARACALSVSVPINFYLTYVAVTIENRIALHLCEKVPTLLSKGFTFAREVVSNAAFAPLATQRKQSDLRQHNYKVRNGGVANRAVLFRSIR